MNGDAEDQAAQAYTITVPGMTDVFIVPTDKKNWRKRQVERIVRMKKSNSPVPKSIQWIPQVINYIDDAQDNLAIALILGKFLLRYVAPRFVPYLGWALLANDLLNVSTALLSLAMTGKAGKLGLREMVSLLAFGRAKRMKKVAQFMSKTNWVGTTIQAGQVLEQHTGYGLRLGGIMGCASDVVWGAVRVLQGKQVRIVGPPPSDPVTKAARFLVQTAQMAWLADEVSLEDHKMILAAQRVAAATLVDGMNLTNMDGRADILQGTEFPVFEPWDQESRDALWDEGISPTGIIRPFYRGTSNIPSFQSVIQRNGQEQWNFEYYQRYKWGKTDSATMLKIIHDEAGRDLMNASVGDMSNLEDVWLEEYNLVQMMTEFSRFPQFKPDEYDMQDFLEFTADEMRYEGLKFITVAYLEGKLKDWFGGWSETSPWQ